MNTTSQRTCRTCGTTYYGDEVEAVFRAAGKPDECTNQVWRSRTCQLCEITVRTEAKHANRFIAKARNTIRHHAKKFGLSVSEMSDRFLWTVDRIAQDMEEMWRKGCEDCGYQFREMHDLTLDINNPVDPPYYGTNTRLICATCNRKKSRTPSRLWGALKAATVRWLKRQEELAKLPRWVQEKMFDA